MIRLRFHARHGEGDEIYNNWVWSSSVHPVYSKFAYYFAGRSGYIFNAAYRDLDVAAVRLVARI